MNVTRVKDHPAMNADESAFEIEIPNEVKSLSVLVLMRKDGGMQTIVTGLDKKSQVDQVSVTKFNDGAIKVFRTTRAEGRQELDV